VKQTEKLQVVKSKHSQLRDVRKKKKEEEEKKAP